MEALTFNNNFGLPSNVRSKQVVFIMKIADIDNYRNSKLSNGKITARISQLFNQVRTKIRVLMLVSINEVSNMVATEKAIIKYRVNNCVIMVKFLIIPMVLYRLDFIKIHNSYRKNQAAQKVKSFLLVGNKLDTGIQFKNTVLVDTKADTSLNVHNKYAPKTNLLMRTNLIIGHVRREFCETIKKGSYTRSIDRQVTSSSTLQVASYITLYKNRPITQATIKTIIAKITRFTFYLPCLFSFSRQASFTHELKLPFPDTNSICASKSSSKRICFVVLFGRSKYFLSFLSCIGSYRYDKLNLKGSYHYISNYFKKAMPQSAGTLSRHLTQPLYEVMIMANRYDSAHLRAEQPKLYKFYDHSTTQVVQSIAPTECQARNNLGKQSLIFIARKPINPVFNHVNNWGYAHA